MIKLITKNEKELQFLKNNGIKNLIIEKNINFSFPEQKYDTISKLIVKSSIADPNTLIKENILVCFNEFEGLDFNSHEVILNSQELQKINHMKFRMATILSHNNGKEIFIYQNDVKGIIKINKNYLNDIKSMLIPNGKEKSINELINLDQSYCTRTNVVKKFLNNDYDQKIEILNFKIKKRGQTLFFY